MYILLSPAKTLIEPPAVIGLPTLEPALLDQTRELMKTTRGLTVCKLKDLMGITDKLATLNRDRFQRFSEPFDADNARQAILSFNGGVYQGLDAKTLTPEDLAFANNHVGILSGLYGLLRPLDLMQPYRLEMGSKLKTRRGPNLYAFWGDRLATEINDRAAGGTLVNLASNEYFKAANTSKLAGPVITPVFRDVKDGKSRTLAFFAKKARGAMTRWAVVNRVTDAEQLKACDAHGYRFSAHESTDARWVFSRPQPPPVGSA
jgi:cytoplasmic iron level regulating protein YaaA (DUF328/UPF0246 family)